MDERTQILKVDPSDLSKVMTGLQYLPITELLGVPEEVSSTAEKVAWQHYHAKTGAFFNVGDIILFGKYKNKKGKVLRFGKNDKGQPTVEIEPIPKGRKKNKTIGLMKIWSLTKKEEALAEKQRKDEKSKTASSVLTRFLEGSFQEPGERTAAMSPEKMQKALEQLRKGTWSPLMASVGRTKEILDHLGGWSVEPFVGLVRYPGFSDTASATMTGSQAEVEAVHALAKKLEVSALPTNPKPDKLYTMKVEDVKDRGGSRDRFDVDFVVYIGSWGWKITSPGNRTLELLPASNSFERLYGWHNSNFVDLTKATKKLGKRVNKFIQLYDIPKFMKGTKLLEQVNEALGTDAHEVSKPRTRENTGSCPCCFRNIKLKSVSGQNHPKMVNHGFERPRWQRRHVGNCIGVGFPPFELSPEGTTHLRDTIVKPQLDEDEKFLRRLRAGEVTVLYIGRSQPKKAITPEHDQWERFLRSRIERTEQSVKELQSDFKILNGLITGWKLEPLPEVGDEMKIWK